MVPDEQEKVITVAGDVWLLGRHRLLCAMPRYRDVEKVMAGELADHGFLRPAVQRELRRDDEGQDSGTHRPIANDNLGADFERFLSAACVNMLAVTKGALYVCMSSSSCTRAPRV